MFSMFVYWKNQQNIERVGKSDTTSHQTKTITSINSNSLVFSLPKQWERAGKSRNQTQITFVFPVHSNQTMLKENTKENKQRAKIILTHWLVTEKILEKKIKNKKLNFLPISSWASDFWLFQLKQTKTKQQNSEQSWESLREIYGLQFFNFF